MIFNILLRFIRQIRIICVLKYKDTDFTDYTDF